MAYILVCYIYNTTLYVSIYYKCPSCIPASKAIEWADYIYNTPSLYKKVRINTYIYIYIYICMYIYIYLFIYFIEYYILYMLYIYILYYIYINSYQME